LIWCDVCMYVQYQSRQMDVGYQAVVVVVVGDGDGVWSMHACMHALLFLFFIHLFYSLLFIPGFSFLLFAFFYFVYNGRMGWPVLLATEERYIYLCIGI